MEHHPELSVSPPTQLHRAQRTFSLGARFLGRDWTIGWLFTTPLVVILLLLIAYPIFVGILLSFQYKLVGSEAHWAGLANYRRLLVGEDHAIFWQSVRVTFIYTGVAVVSKLLLGLGMALVLNERFPGRNIFRAFFFLPWAAPTVVVALTWRWLYDGTIHGFFNLLLTELFHRNYPVQFLANPRYALWAVILVVIWQGTPFYIMMLLAGLQAIPAELYEAAAIDGANAWHRFRAVTMPGLRSTITVTVLLSTIWTANSINFIYILTGGGPVNATMTFPMLAYQIGIGGSRQLGLAAAVSIIFLPAFLPIIYYLSRMMVSTSQES